MQDSDFHDEVDEIFDALEDALDEVEDDVDVDNSGGVLNVTCPNGSSVIFSRQVATHEIWIAAKSGGFHLHKNDSGWFCAPTNETLDQIVRRIFSEQMGQEIGLPG